MVWGGFGLRGKLQLVFTSSRMNSQEYQEVLQTSLLPFIDQHNDTSFIFMHDNARIHTSSSTKAWLVERNIPVFKHPARSPDLNPIENIWGILVNRVYSENRNFETKDELKRAIQIAWNGLEDEVIVNLVQSMQNRIFQLINRNGGPIDY